ncbi:MAG: TetR/AcrR family transcriptional regulator [Chloroflexota bacterium]
MSSRSDSDTLNQILTAAAELLQTRGDTFTMEQLSAHTGLSRATLYRQVGSKEALLQKVAEAHDIEIQELNQPGMRERILEAARVVFSQFGMARPTMEQIAEEAGVGVATVYRHFGDRQSLMRAFAEGIAPNVTLQQVLLTPEADFVETLYHLAETAVTFMYEYRDMIRHTIGAYSEDLSLFAQVRAVQEKSIQLLAQFLQNQMDTGRLTPADPRELAFAMIGTIFAFTVMRPTFYDVPITDPAQTARFVVDLFLSGIQMPTPG